MVSVYDAPVAQPSTLNSKWQGWLNGCKYQTHKNPQGFEQNPPKILGLKIPPPPSQLPLFCLLIGQKNTKFSGTNQKAERRRSFGTGLVRHCPQGLFSLFFTFLRAIFFRPFRLSFAPTIYPWVCEDGSECYTRNNLSLYSEPFPHANLWRQNNFWTFDLPIWMWGFFQIFLHFEPFQSGENFC